MSGRINTIDKRDNGSSHTQRILFIWRNFWRDESGAPILEFTLVFMILAGFFLSMVEFSEAFTVKRRVKAAAFSIADIVARSETISENELDQLNIVVTEYLKPYIDRASASTPEILITSVTVDDVGNATVDWSSSIGEAQVTPPGAGTDFPLGITFTQEDLDSGTNRNFIVAEVRYSFTSPIGFYYSSSGTPNLTHIARVPTRKNAAVVKVP